LSTLQLATPLHVEIPWKEIFSLLSYPGETCIMNYVCVFCGASSGARPSYTAAAQAVGRALAQRGLGLVYGGGKVGLMGALADAALAAGAEVIGVIPDVLVAKELAHPSLSKLHIVRSMHERKALMADLSDAFVALPGGYGTLEEFCEVLTWAQLGLHQKPLGLLNTDDYYQPLLAFFDHAVTERFLSPTLRALIIEAALPETLLDFLVEYQPQVVDKWLKRGEE
jgi:uncharacterized protein (TIGR00730 family)